MAKQVIQLGLVANDGTGDQLRTAFNKTNENFTELYNSVAGLQASDADLTAIGALTGTSGFLKKTAANTWSLDTSTYLTSTSSLVNGSKTATLESSGTLVLPSSTEVTGSQIKSSSANKRMYILGEGATGSSHLTWGIGTDTPTLANVAEVKVAQDGVTLFVRSRVGAQYYWTFDSNGYLTLPGTGAPFNGDDVSNWNTAYGWGNHASAGYITSTSSLVNGNNTFSLGSTGTLTTPAGLSISKQLNGSAVHIGSTIQSDLNKNLQLQTIGTGFSTFGWQNFEGDINFVTLNYNQSKNILITTGNAVGGGVTHNWMFASTGNLQLPAGGTIVDSAGNSVLNGISLSTLKTIVADSTDFADFKTRIAAL
jgi:hypothetical protein